MEAWVHFPELADPYLGNIVSRPSGQCSCLLELAQTRFALFTDGGDSDIAKRCRTHSSSFHFAAIIVC
jgi:hypothetical protein